MSTKEEVEKPIKEWTKEEFTAKVLLQIWMLGGDPYTCLAYCKALSTVLQWTDNEELYSDLETILDILEFHEAAGQLPNTFDGILAVVKQYYGEKQ